MGRASDRIDVCAALRTDDGAAIPMTGQRLHTVGPEVRALPAANEAVDPALHDFRTALLCKTQDPPHRWLTGLLSVGDRMRNRDDVTYRLFEIL